MYIFEWSVDGLKLFWHFFQGFIRWTGKLGLSWRHPSLAAIMRLFLPQLLLLASTRAMMCLGRPYICDCGCLLRRKMLNQVLNLQIWRSSWFRWPVWKLWARSPFEGATDLLAEWQDLSFDQDWSTFEMSFSPLSQRKSFRCLAFQVAVHCWSVARSIHRASIIGHLGLALGSAYLKPLCTLVILSLRIFLFSGAS